MNRIFFNKFEENTQSTLACGNLQKEIKLKNGNTIMLTIWDTMGQEKFRQIVQLFLIDSDCVIFGYDITNKKSFDSIQNYWYPMTKENISPNLIYLLANKIDLSNNEIVNEEMAKKYEIF